MGAWPDDAITTAIDPTAEIERCSSKHSQGDEIGANETVQRNGGSSTNSVFQNSSISNDDDDIGCNNAIFRRNSHFCHQISHYHQKAVQEENVQIQIDVKGGNSRGTSASSLLSTTCPSRHPCRHFRRPINCRRSRIQAWLEV